MKKLSHLGYFLILLLVLGVHLQSSEQSFAEPALQGAHVIEVNDGDTVTLRFNWKDHRTRLIGIDAPELGQHLWGRRAKDHLIEIMNHTEWYVYVETDVIKRDKYGRLLAYLWTQKKELINEQMIIGGYAVLFTISPNVKYTAKFEGAEKRARREKKGIWGQNGLTEMPFEYRNEHPRGSYLF